MARVIKAEEHAAKRNQILDVAQRLIYAKGYEKMAIQDVLDGLQMSKGAFYHYFDSKQTLLLALLDRMVDELELLLVPIAQDPELSALDKLYGYFNGAAIWKTERKTLMFALMRVWYSDENTLVRERLINMAILRLGPLLSQIIRQGVCEGVMTTQFPDDVAGMIYTVFQTMGESLTNLLLAPEPMPDRLERLERALAFYADTLERVLGTPPGALRLMDENLVKQWAEVPQAELDPAEALAVL